MKHSKMRQLMLVLTAFIIFSCTKSNTVVPNEPGPQTIVIGGNSYAIKKIGNLSWTTSNYAGPGGVFFDNANSKPIYGKYYTRAEMKAITVPAGWRIPSMNDFKQLATTAGVNFDVNVNNTEAIKKLTASSGWLNVQGSNALGFNAHPGGYITNNTAPMGGDNAEFWTSDDHTFSLMEAGNQNRLNITFYSYSLQEEDRFNIRFVKD